MMPLYGIEHELHMLMRNEGWMMAPGGLVVKESSGGVCVREWSGEGK